MEPSLEEEREVGARLESEDRVQDSSGPPVLGYSWKFWGPLTFKPRRRSLNDTLYFCHPLKVSED